MGENKRRPTVWDHADPAELTAFCADYRSFISENKTERACVSSIRAMLDAAGGTKLDALIEAERTMKTFAEREAVYRKIDHILTEACPHAFLWNISSKRLLYWNKFGMPASVLSRYGNEADVLSYWWYDPDRAAELAEAMEKGTYLPSVPERVDYDAVMKGRAP